MRHLFIVTNEKYFTMSDDDELHGNVLRGSHRQWKFPAQYHRQYYRSLLFASDFINYECSWVVDSLLEFVCGELDFSEEFFRTDIWKTMKQALHDTPRDYLHTLVRNESSIMSMQECHDIAKVFKPSDIDTGDFWKVFEEEYFESIWLYFMHESADPKIDESSGLYEDMEFKKHWWFCGTMNPDKFGKLYGNLNRIYVKVLISEIESESELTDKWTVIFVIGDSIDQFWMNAIDWNSLPTSTIKKFHPRR